MMDRGSVMGVLAGISTAALAGSLFPAALPWLGAGALLGLGYGVWCRVSGRCAQTREERTLETLRKKHRKNEEKKHRHIHDQITYIARNWGYTKEQERIIERFLATRAYGEIYNRLTASLLPQIILLIDQCNARGQKGCKRDVSRRLRALTDLMREQTRRHQSRHQESFETTLEVYDRLLAD